MDISVVICTYNRRHHLKNVLKSLSEQVVPENLKWEIIIVDNNSTDDTKDVVTQIANYSNFPIHYIFEPKQGKSYALNNGIRDAKGKIIAFTDDDIILDKHWIETISDSFQEYRCDGLCGRINLHLPERIPRWLTKELWGFLGYLDYGDKPFFITKEDIFGGNVAYTKEIIKKTGFFNIEIGRMADKLMGGEDVEYGKKVIKNGGKVLYEPSLKVFHVIEPSKLKKSYFLKLHFCEGVVSGRFFSEQIRRHIAGIPLFAFIHLFKSIMKYFSKPTFRMQMNIWWFLGFIQGRILQYKK